MPLTSLIVLRQVARTRLRQAAWGTAGVLALLLAGLTAITLAIAAGVLATAERIGTVEALLIWSGGMLLLTLLGVLYRMLARRRRHLQGAEWAGAAPVSVSDATLLSDIGFRAGMDAGNALSPLGAVAAAFVIGTLIARGGRR